MLACSPPRSPLPFQNPPILPENYPESPSGVKANLRVLLITVWLWVAGAVGTGPSRAAASQGGSREDRMQNPVRTRSASWNERH